jgi:hypothetical protein
VIEVNNDTTETVANVSVCSHKDDGHANLNEDVPSSKNDTISHSSTTSQMIESDTLRQ